MILDRLFGITPETTPERRLYEEIVAQARQPWLYADAGVPDTVSGRFEMIVLHAVLVIDRLCGESETGREFAQRVFEELFKDMDASLREMGVGDLAVGPRIKNMAQVFYGRSRAYAGAFAGPPEARRQDLIAILSRNVLEGCSEADPAPLADYVFELRRRLAHHPAARLLTGEAGFRPPPRGTRRAP